MAILFTIWLPCFFSPSVYATNISGRVELEENWEPVIYLSLINSFEDLNTMSYDFLIARAHLDSSGYFEINDLVLPEGDRIYRLHACKKGDPVSTIMIGGKDENFLHLIMNNNSQVIVTTETGKQGVTAIVTQGHAANSSLVALFNLEKRLQIPPSLPSRQNREITIANHRKAYLEIADTSSFLLIKLLAIHLVNELYDSPDIGLMERTFNSISVPDSSSPYYSSFISQLDYLRYTEGRTGFPDSKWINWIGGISLIILLVLVFWMRVRKKGKSKEADFSDLLKSLSIQEKKVFELLREGASNKEISSQLNIEVSTVKSHVHKIFSRLGVKSRKEIVNGQWKTR